MSNHNITGKKGEALAAAFLKKKHYEILSTNWRYERAEIDIIARKGSTIIFVEVKTRSTDYHGYPEEAVDAAKQNNIQKAAEAYLEENNINSEIRFDIIAVILSKQLPDIHHIEDAFFPYGE